MITRVANPTIAPCWEELAHEPLTRLNRVFPGHLAGAARPLPDQAFFHRAGGLARAAEPLGEQMTEPSAATTGIVPAPPARLEPDAIGVAQDTVIGMASSAPAASVGLTLAALAAATAYGSGPIIILTAIPMLVIANAYRRLNMWNANCGASFEWVGRAINPIWGSSPAG